MHLIFDVDQTIKLKQTVNGRVLIEKGVDMKLVLSLVALMMGGVIGGSAQAAVVYAGPTAEMATDSSFSVNFNSGMATTAALSFVLNGYASLDGQNFYEDDFTLTLNGTQIFAGTFNLGGGSDTTQAVVFSNPLGATFTNPTNNGTGICFCGGQETFSFAGVQLLAGNNELTFAYNSVADANHAGFQGLGDEGWGVQNVTVSAVPELSTWAMMILGFCGLGLWASRLKQQGRALTPT
ncbi:hypothetical protein L6654_37830 [Bradyrhizobium sp. WYCCWR 13023]|uniref:PEP-CTERM sorting domain-containing protein n=1 Tax=Bradyrhizobium zhengyangense TaxID=2911009 RepID=A0A9X1RJK2_9BRAD|nr:hypothetical protein [Bradyrhizobium zhengyangense]MCG2632378.1 hypothetical protein [Bradyrhizobium zhengyangense]